ncbi:MAG: sugar phosphate isomerase/epimerase family protein [Planctomycetota bacterium]
MPNEQVQNRRDFLAKGTALAAAGITGLGTSPVAAQEPKAQPKICAFTKFLQDLSYDELARTIKELGFDGVEATVRKKGHVLPERVEEDMPKMVDALKRHDVEIVAMASDVTGADALSEKVLKTATGLGVKWYRMGFLKYDLKKPIIPQLKSFKPQINELADLNRQLGVQGLYQNHSDAKYMGATLWDLRELIHDLPVEQIGSAFDIRHTTIEAGLSWPVIYDVMKPHIGAIFVKDFNWDKKKAKHVALGTGRVDPKFFDLVRESGFKGPYSLHVEYLGKEGVEANVAALKRDLKQLREWLS